MSGDPVGRRLRRGDPGYPERLEHLDRPPEILWVAGTPVPRCPAVAIVGSRWPTAGGRATAFELGAELGRAGVPVVSGFALGIDSAAHRGVLSASGGTTIAVLGCGLDVPYPRGQEDLRRAVTGAGMLLTEYPEGASPEPWHFPRRNRIIAALSVAVVVVEASERSGALSTARWAADLGREVLAVPGSIRSDRSRGCNQLIRDGARPFLGVDDLGEALPELAGRLPLAGAARGRLTTVERGLEPALREVLARLGDDGLHPDTLAADLALPAPVVSARLTELELRGLVHSLPGGLVARTG